MGENHSQVAVAGPSRNFDLAPQILEVFNAMRKENMMCDVTLVVEKKEILAHKTLLAASSPYFRAMFSAFEESQKNQIVLQDVNPIALQMLIDYLYTSEITIDENNVQVLLPAANFLQISFVKEECSNFLKSQLHPSNSLGIRAFADLHECPELLKAAESFIGLHFSNVAMSEEFLALPYENVLKLIKSDDLSVESEGKVYECVISWVKHKLEERQKHLANLMEYVRLPLVPYEYLIEKVQEDALFISNEQCKDYLLEAFKYQLVSIKSNKRFLSQTPRTTPRWQPVVPKTMVVKGGQRLQCYDFATESWTCEHQIPGTVRMEGAIAALENKVYVIGGHDILSGSQLENLIYDPITEEWTVSSLMSIGRESFGVAILNNCIYVIGGSDSVDGLDSSEMFDPRQRQWNMIAPMSTRRSNVGAGVINDLLYAVGGFDDLTQQCLNSVERYCPETNTWTLVASMIYQRRSTGVGVLDGLLYAVGGEDDDMVQNSVEAYNPDTDTWSIIPPMSYCRHSSGVVGLNGLLYVVGGTDGILTHTTVEVYNPMTKQWSILPTSIGVSWNYISVVVIDKPPTTKPNSCG